MENNKRFMNLLLTIGVFSVLVGIFFLLLIPAKQFNKFIIVHILILLLGGTQLCVSLIKQNSLAFFIGFNICVFSLVAVLFSTSFYQFSIWRYWPIIVISCGLSLIPTGYLKFRSFRTVYMFPSVILTSIGIFFLMFSLKIIKTPLRAILAYSWPIVLMILGGILISVYFYRQRSTNYITKFDTDEKGDFRGEED